MAKYVGRDAGQKAFVKLLDSLCYSRSRWNIWTDMISIMATAISNSVRHPFWDQREKEYLSIIQGYNKKEQQVFVDLFAMLVQIMDDAVNADSPRFGDFLGDLFMQLDLGNDSGGQFFTPYDLCRAMAEMTYTDDIPKMIEANGYISVNDCAVGAGALLIAWAEILHKHGINYQTSCVFTAQEIDYTTAQMCYIQLSLLGCPGYVVIGNSLTDPMTGHVLFGENTSRCWYTPMFYTAHWEFLRAMAKVKRIISDVATALPEAATAATSANMPVIETAGKAISEASSEAPPEPETVEAFQPTFKISTRKKNEGQLMFDFG